MATVSINGVAYDIYGTSAGADAYHAANPKADAWRAAGVTDKNRALVEAARSFNRQSWVGDATDPVTPQPLAWPRTGVVDRNGQAVSDAVVPQDVVDASYEWALVILGDADVAAATPGTNTKRTRELKRVEGAVTTDVETELFRPTIGQAGRFPLDILELLAPFLQGASSVGLAYASGTDVSSGFTTADRDFGFSEPGLDGGSNS